MRNVRLRRHTLLGNAVFVAAAIVMLFATVAAAVHDDGALELGPSAASPVNGTTTANILGANDVAGPDWNDLFDPDGSLTDTNGNDIPDAVEVFGGEAATFVQDDLAVSGATDRTTFASSNKNNDLVETWNWDTGNAPVKNDLSNVYAYAKIVNGDLVIYSGLERLSSNGDSHVDVEFNQNEVGTDKGLDSNGDFISCGTDGTDGASDGAPCEFEGEKSANDIVVSLDYTKGGTLGSLEVRKWTGTTYAVIATLADDEETDDVNEAQGCNVLIENGFDIPADSICAWSNAATIDGGDWPNYDSHGAVTNALAANQFAEFGININNILNVEEAPCFATLNAHTRTSQSFTAELSDFALGRFELCAPSTALSVDSDAGDVGGTPTIQGGDTVTVTFSESNDGNTVLDNPSVTATVEPSSASLTCSPTGVETGGFNDGDDDTNGDFDPGETWDFACEITVPEGTEEITVSGVGHGTDPLGRDVTWHADCEETGDTLNTDSDEDIEILCDEDEQASITIDVINPSTALDVDVVATFTFTETNDGDAPISNPTVTATGCDSAPEQSVDGSGNNVGDTNGNDVLDVGEEWVWTCTVTVDEGSTDVDAEGSGSDGLGNSVEYCDPADSTDTVTCDPHEGAEGSVSANSTTTPTPSPTPTT